MHFFENAINFQDVLSLSRLCLERNRNEGENIKCQAAEAAENVNVDVEMLIWV